MGRPKKEDSKVYVNTIRLSKSELEELMLLSSLCGMTKTEYIKTALEAKNALERGKRNLPKQSEDDYFYDEMFENDEDYEE